VKAVSGEGGRAMKANWAFIEEARVSKSLGLSFRLANQYLADPSRSRGTTVMSDLESLRNIWRFSSQKSKFSSGLAE
jgi:hypothetical protein